MYEGFGYGQKPNLIETIFSLRNYKNSFILLTMLLGPLALFVPVFFMLLGAIFQNWRTRVRE